MKLLLPAPGDTIKYSNMAKEYVIDRFLLKFGKESMIYTSPGFDYLDRFCDLISDSRITLLKKAK